MGDDSGYTKKEKDWLGRDKEVHFNEDDEKTGETTFTTDWKGQSKQIHVDAGGEKTGETRSGTDFFGRARAEHVDENNEVIGHSRDEKDWCGKSVQVHYDTSGNKVGETRSGHDWLGRARKEHTGQYFKAAERSQSSEDTHYGGSGATSSTAIAASGTGKGWLIVGGFAIVALIAYGLGELKGVNVGGAGSVARSGVPVYNLQCGQTFDVQIPPAVRTAFFVVPPCKCADLSELNYDCTGWVRIMEPNRYSQMNMRSDDSSAVNECIVLWEYRKGRGPQGIVPGTPIKIGGCNANSHQEISTLRTRHNPNEQSLAIPDRFTVQNVQELPIRVRIDFY
jgi:hypothetical protein